MGPDLAMSKCCSYHFIGISMETKYFQHISIIMEQSSVKWVPDSNKTTGYSQGTN